MIQSDEELKSLYEKMRNLNPGLPEWDDASSSLRELHTKMYKSLIQPVVDKLADVTSKVKK